MPPVCKNICIHIAEEQNRLKKEMFKHRKYKGTRPKNTSIASISKFCSHCNKRFYFIDYGYCKCCGMKLRSRTVHSSLGEIERRGGGAAQVLAAAAPQQTS